MARSVNSKPPPSGAEHGDRRVPDVGAAAAHVVATAWVARRPRRSTETSTVTGPAGTWAANTVVTVRSRWAGSPISAAIAAAVSAVIIPPWGTIGQFQRGSTSTR